MRLPYMMRGHCSLRVSHDSFGWLRTALRKPIHATQLQLQGRLQ